MKYLSLLISIVCITLIPQKVSAQYVNEQLREEIEKLDFMTGQWDGSGWMRMQDGSKAEFEQTENIYFKLNNTLLVIEGRGTDPETGTIVHDAFAIVSYLPDEEQYRFESFLSDGRGTITNGKLADENIFVWWIDRPDGARILYTIDFSEEGKWKEIAEYFPNPEAENGRTFLEMNLERIEK